MDFHGFLLGVQKWGNARKICINFIKFVHPPAIGHIPGTPDTQGNWLTCLPCARFGLGGPSQGTCASGAWSGCRYAFGKKMPENHQPLKPKSRAIWEFIASNTGFVGRCSMEAVTVSPWCVGPASTHSAFVGKAGDQLSLTRDWFLAQGSTGDQLTLVRETSSDSIAQGVQSPSRKSYAVEGCSCAVVFASIELHQWTK